MLMKKSKIIILSLALIFTFIIIYSPHLNYPFPYHIDEWHHITESIKLFSEDYSFGIGGTEIGFHLFLSAIYLFSNLILIFKFLPALWAMFTTATLFLLVYKKTNNFLIGIFSIIFFASIKSNVNITGLWFFTPLTFSLPFIFLYVYFFTEGVEKQNKKNILISLCIMIFLLFTHAISVLFAIPFLILYSLVHLNYFKKEWKFFSLFLLIPIIGILFYKFLMHLSFKEVIPNLLSMIQFNQAWGIIEFNNPLLTIYSLTGYLLALVGVISILLFQPPIRLKKYLLFILWPATLIISMIIYKLTGISFLSPYQRNLYYFAISLPILSAFGVFYLLKPLKRKIENSRIKEKELIHKILLIITFVILLILLFNSYHQTSQGTQLYKVINEKDYSDILLLKNLPSGKVIANPSLSTAIFPISQKEVVGTIYFYGNKQEIEKFFSAKSCEEKEEILERNQVSYILSQEEINCEWNLISQQNNYIYQVKLDSQNTS